MNMSNELFEKDTGKSPGGGRVTVKVIFFHKTYNGNRYTYQGFVYVDGVEMYNALGNNQNEVRRRCIKNAKLMKKNRGLNQEFEV